MFYCENAKIGQETWLENHDQAVIRNNGYGPLILDLLPPLHTAEFPPELSYISKVMPFFQRTTAKRSWEKKAHHFYPSQVTFVNKTLSIFDTNGHIKPSK